MIKVRGRYVIKECGCEYLVADPRWTTWIEQTGRGRSVTGTLLGGLFVAEQLAHDVWVERRRMTARDDQREGEVAGQGA